MFEFCVNEPFGADDWICEYVIWWFKIELILWRLIHVFLFVWSIIRQLFGSLFFISIFEFP